MADKKCRPESKGRGSLRAPNCQLSIYQLPIPYCTVSDTFWECDTTPSVAVTVTVYVPRAVGTLSVSLREPDFVASAWEVAVTFTVAGSPGANIGAVYRPLASIVPLAGAPVTAQVTALLEVLFTAATNCAVCEGQPA